MTHVILPPEKQPPNDIEFFVDDRKFVKQIFLAKKGTIVPQHAHTKEHTSRLCLGSMSVCIEGYDLGVVKAPCDIKVAAFKKHKFASLEDNTMILCIWDDYPEMFEEHQLKGG